MEINVPPGFNTTRFGGSLVVPGTRIHLRRQADKRWFIGEVQPDGSLVLTLDQSRSR